MTTTARQTTRSASRSVLNLLWVLAASMLVPIAAFAQANACDQLKATLAARIEATGVRGYSLETVPASTAVPAGAKAIGNCEGGARKVLYRRWGGASASASVEAAAVPAAPLPSAVAPEPRPKPPPPAVRASVPAPSASVVAPMPVPPPLRSWPWLPSRPRRRLPVRLKSPLFRRHALWPRKRRQPSRPSRPQTSRRCHSGSRSSFPPSGAGCWCCCSCRLPCWAGPGVPITWLTTKTVCRAARDSEKPPFAPRCRRCSGHCPAHRRLSSQHRVLSPGSC